MSKEIYSVCLVFGIINAITATSIPSYIHICHRDDPKVSACIKNSIEELRPRLKQGIPELDVPSLEPLRINDMQIARGSSNSYLKLDLTEIDLTGGSDFQLTKLKLDVPNMTYKIGITFPKMRLQGKYSVDTRILSLPIKSDGRFDAVATNCIGVGILKGELVHGPNYDHMNFTNLDIQLKIGDYSLKLDNIIKGDPQLSDTLNELVNTNKEELIKLSTPFIEAKASETLLNLANKIVKNFEHDVVFPK